MEATMPKTLLAFFLCALSLAAEYKPLNRPYDVEHYKLSFDFDPAEAGTKFKHTVEIKLKTLAPLDQLEFDQEDLEIHSAKLLPSRSALEVDLKDPKLVKVGLKKKYPKGSVLTLALETTATIQSGHYGFFKVIDPDEKERGDLFFTHLEANGARKIYPCNDEPYDKATFEVVARVPQKIEVLSNGKRLKDKTLKLAGKPYREIHWVLEKPQSTYLMSLAIGPFTKLSQKAGSTDLTVWVGKSKAEKAKYVSTATQKSMEFIEKYTGVKYPWPQYSIVTIPTFLWGGMENTSSTHMNQERTLLNDPSSSFEKKRIVGLTAHELAHQWFGDYVTMKWWDDVWLNESFASLMGTRSVKNFFQNEEAELESIVDVWDDYFRQEDGPRSHPIVDKTLSSPDDAFDSINYTKGENVLRMLSFYMGEEKFKKGVSLYLKNNGYANANYKDFFSAMEKASNVKLDKFVESWILKRGYPVIRYSSHWDAARSVLEVKLSQRPNHAEDSHFFDMKLPITVHRKNTPAFSKNFVVDFSEAEKTVSFPLAMEPDWVTVNPEAAVLAKVELEDKKEGLLSTMALQDPDPFTRVWAAFYLSKGFWEGETPSEITSKTIVEILNSDPSPYVRNMVLDSFRRMKAKALPETIGLEVLKLAKQSILDSSSKNLLYKVDPHGWSQFRSNLIGALGKVENPAVLTLLKNTLLQKNLPVDDLQRASAAIAATGDEKAFEVLQAANTLHSPRGYIYTFHLIMAFGAFQNPKAVKEIEKISETASPDILGRIGWTIKDNHALVSSSEWSEFLKKFLVKDTRTGDEVKARLLNTVEEIKSSDVKKMLKSVSEESDSDRLKDLAKKMLDKNFG